MPLGRFSVRASSMRMPLMWKMPCCLFCASWRAGIRSCAGPVVEGEGNEVALVAGGLGGGSHGQRQVFVGQYLVGLEEIGYVGLHGVYGLEVEHIARILLYGELVILQHPHGRSHAVGSRSEEFGQVVHVYYRYSCAAPLLTTQKNVRF